MTDIRLGWKRPDRIDERNWPMGRALELLQAGATPTKLDLALAALLANQSTALSIKSWAKLVTQALDGTPAPTPTPTPTPPPAPTAVLWEDKIVLDQGQVGSCVGNAWCGLSDASPMPHVWREDKALAIYWLAKQLDGEPNVDDGTSVQQGANASKQLNLITAYVFAKNAAEALKWVLTQGPVVIGSDWYTGMMDIDSAGFVHPTGQVEGGHSTLIIGYDSTTRVVTGLNSWGLAWGKTGRYLLHEADFTSLIGSGGEAAAATEVA